MAIGPIQQKPAVPGAVPLPRVPQHPVTLLGDIHALTRALAAPPTDPSWRERMSLWLGPVRRGFAEHVRATEGPEGLYAELIAHAPRLARGVHRLSGEHVAIGAELAALEHTAELPGASADELRRRVGHLLRELVRHRQHGADLLWQAYQTDIGGET